MASREINLITRKRKLTPEVMRLRAGLIKYMPLGLGIYALILAIIFGYSFYLNRQLDQVTSEVASTKSQIDAMRVEEGKYLILKSKSLSLTKILNNRYPYVETMEYFQSLENPNTQINSLKLTEAGDVQIQIAVKDSTALNDLVNSLLAGAGTKLQRIDLNSINYQDDGSIALGLTVAAGGRKRV